MVTTDVDDPTIQQDTDAIIRITTTAICGSDLHLYEVLGPFMTKGDVVGHESMGVVEAVGSAVTRLQVGDRVVVPFNISCGDCYMCRQGLQSQCETTQVHEYGSGAALFGYSKLYGSVPGGQAELLRVPFADYGPIKVEGDFLDEQYLYLSDILPTAWQAVKYADVEQGGSLAVLGLGPVGQLASRIGTVLGLQVIGVEPVAERRQMAERHGVSTLDLDDDVAEQLQAMTSGRGPDAVIDAVGMEAHGSPVAAFAHKATALLPDKVAEKAMTTAGLDRLAAIQLGIQAVRRGGTLSISGVYGGQADPLPLMTMFDKQLQLRMGQCNVRRWTEDLLPYVEREDDPFGLTDLATHRLTLDDAPKGYDLFQRKADGCIKVLLKP
ncbi:zinc-dependent alcohol dehydrogenase [Microlunatus panaciterrae]